MSHRADPAESLPSRGRFQWDLKSPPWTDGRGNQENYVKAVSLWVEFHNALPESNSNKVPQTLQGLMLKSQLFGRAADLASKVSNEELRSADGAMKIARAVHKVDALSQVTKMAEQFANLLTTQRQSNESLQSFEVRFDAQICKFNDAAGSAVLPKALLALLLMSNASIDNSQRVSLLACVAPPNSDVLTGPSLFNAIDYDKIASVLRSSDAPRNNHASTPALYANSSTVSRQSIAEQKKNSKCHKCDQYGHWSKDPECPLTKVNKEKKEESVSTSHSAEPRRARTITFH